MIIPKHVIRIAFDIQQELESQMRKGNNDKETIRCLNKIRKINNQLRQDSKEIKCYVEMMELMKDIIDASIVLSESVTMQIYKEVYIEPELIYVINHTKIMKPRIAQELDMVCDFLKQIPMQGWKESDKTTMYNEVKLVKTKSRWENLMEKHCGCDLSVSRDDNGLRLNHIKIGYITTSASTKLLETAGKAKEFLLITLGEKKFRKYKEAFNVWFRIGETKTYYIYIPR